MQQAMGWNPYKTGIVGAPTRTTRRARARRQTNFFGAHASNDGT
jgi:hypothetical protein